MSGENPGRIECDALSMYFASKSSKPSDELSAYRRLEGVLRAFAEADLSTRCAIESFLRIEAERKEGK